MFLYWRKLPSIKSQDTDNPRFSLFTSIFAALGLSLLQFVEQQRPHRLSTLTAPYLLASISCDIIYLSTSSNIAPNATISRAVLFRCCLQSMLLIFHYTTTHLSTLEVTHSNRPPQEIHSLLSQQLFLWINPILLRGYKGIFTKADMPPLDQEIMPESTRKAMVETWSQRGQQELPVAIIFLLLIRLARPETPKTLPLTLMKCLRTPFLAAIVPRLLLIIFRYSQPFLISQSIKYSAASPTVSETSHGYWLVLSAVTIYVGIAVSCNPIRYIEVPCLVCANMML